MNNEKRYVVVVENDLKSPEVLLFSDLKKAQEALVELFAWGLKDKKECRKVDELNGYVVNLKSSLHENLLPSDDTVQAFISYEAHRAFYKEDIECGKNYIRYYLYDKGSFSAPEPESILTTHTFIVPVRFHGTIEYSIPMEVDIERYHSDPEYEFQINQEAEEKAIELANKERNFGLLEDIEKDAFSIRESN